MSWVAYVDECEAVQPGHVYSVAASLIDPAAGEEIAAVMSSLMVRPAKKLHWYEEHKAERRRLLASSVAGLAGVEHVVVVLAEAPEGTRMERRRRHCLTTLLPELQDLGVTRVIAEAREAKQNRRDVDLVLALRNEKRITGPFRMDHAPGPSTPLLAIADITAGAVMASYAGEDSYREILRDKLTVIEI